MKDRASARSAHFVAVLLQNSRDARSQGLPAAEQICIDVRSIGERVQRGSSGSQRNKIAVQRTRVHHFTALDVIHIRLAAREHAERHTGAYCLRISGKVRKHTIEALRSCKSKPKTGDDFIKDQQSAM